MRFALLSSLAVAVFLPALAHAQPRAKLQVRQVRVGYFAGNPMPDAEGDSNVVYKAGAWTPIYIDIGVGPPGLKGTEGRIDVVIETVDADDVATSYTVNVGLPELGPGGTFTVAGYTKPASPTSDITITLKHDNQPLGNPYKRQYPGGLDAAQAVYLTVGSRMSGLRQTLRGAEDRPGNNNISNNENPVFMDRVHELPDQWFGYDGVDLVILSTTKRNDFLIEFASPRQARRRQALEDWVKRGGHLIVSAGKNYDLLASMPEIQAMMPVTLTKVESLRELVLELDNGQGGLVTGGKRPPIEVVRMTSKPDRSFQVLLSQRPAEGEGQQGPPLIVQGPYGLGRVTVVGFDLDQKPFADWNKQAAAWQWLLARSWARENKNAGENMPPNMRMYGYSEGTELLGQMQNHLENFEEVPVISFFWVALFILIYIIVVGPLDYFFLKKVVKRLELTWITFPTVVLVVSAAAYFTAYWLKGSDLRIRKVDFVDIDLPAEQTVGHTWFTLFSPRIQHYTVGIEPVWAPPLVEGGEGPSVLVSWMSRPETNRFAPTRARGQSLFRRSYDYEGTATGLRGVPIQVWSTKSFEATWQAPLKNMPMPVTATLRHPADRPGTVSGQITWLPDAKVKEGNELREAFLIYKGRAHPFPLKPGEAKKVDQLPLEHGGEAISSWIRSGVPNSPNPGTVYYRGRYVPANSGADIDGLIKSALFHEAADRSNVNQRNDGLRLLDQTWRARLENTDEVILVGRLAAKRGQAEEVTQEAASPSRLWLGDLPAAGKERPRLDGTLLQETYVRIFIPIERAPKKN